MKAIIMAGGEGTRLRPLTCDCPKPMMRLMDKPVMQYALELLLRHGISRVAATLGYLPDAISDYFGDGSDFGVHLQYYVEQSPMGTAGGVRCARDFLDETFVVLSGDGVTDADLSAALTFHRARRALATLVLCRRENPMDYGIVSTDSQGRILEFYEKPDRCDTISDTVNTGIYILEPAVLDKIPDGVPFDFGRDLFPRLVSEGAAVYGWIMDGYWCDIGDVQAYLTAHRDAMDGRIHLPGLCLRPSGTAILPGARIDRTARIEAPCLIAEGAQIGAGAHIGAYSVVGENCVVGAGASLKRAVLWTGAQVEAHAQARGCVLAAHSVLDVGAHAYEESILGTGSSAAERAVLMPGVRLWPGKGCAPGEHLDANVVWGSRRSDGFAAGSFRLTAPSQAARAAQSCASVLNPEEILLGRGPSTVSDALWHAVAAGMMAQGVQVIDGGVCVLPQLRCAQSALRCPCAALVSDDRLILLNENGARLSSRQQHSINTMNARHDYAAPFSDLTRPILSAGPTDIAYIADAAARFESDGAKAPPIALHAQSPRLLSLAERIFSRAGLSLRAEWEDDMMELAPLELGIWLDERGESAVFADERGALTESEQQLLKAWTALQAGERDLILPVSATRAIASLAERFGACVRSVSGEPSLWMNELAQASPFQFMLWFDGIQSALSSLSALVGGGFTLESWRCAVPHIHRRSRTVSVPLSRTGQVLNAFAQSEPRSELGGGLRFERENGWGWICPDETKPEFKIVTESANAEFARELCDFCEKQLLTFSQK